ncbi:MAG: 7-carboxy-7-deazaguanine synthase [Solirubrobacterales bacterium]
MAYAVKEIFYSLQGEGAQVGRPAVFCRFAGCNLWTGREEDRLDAICSFCDTDFRGVDGTLGGRYESAVRLVNSISALWPRDRRRDRIGWVICTGGEPLLQLDASLIDELHARGFAVAIETNGTLLAPKGLDWICVSPKAGAPLVQSSGNELKVVFPQPQLSLDELEGLAFDHFFLQPMDGADLRAHTKAALEYCLAHPVWRLSLQTHKVLEIP